LKTALTALLAFGIAANGFASAAEAGPYRPRHRYVAHEITVHAHVPRIGQPAYVPADPDGVTPSEWLAWRRRPAPPGYFGPCGYWNDCGWMPGQVLGGLTTALGGGAR
jgi:hypothetical protein